MGDERSYMWIYEIRALQPWPSFHEQIYQFFHHYLCYPEFLQN